jgi:hypothetical protein
MEPRDGENETAQQRWPCLLEKMAPNTWVRAFFIEYPKCDILLNNTCEVFNRYILDARELPILCMLQSING